MNHSFFILALTLFVNTAFAEPASEALTSREKVIQLSSYYQQQRKLAEIAESQRAAEARHFVPTASFESFTLTEADPIHPESESLQNSVAAD